MKELWLLERMQGFGDRQALIWKDNSYSYAWLVSRTAELCDQLARIQLAPGAIAALTGDFSPNAVAMLLALIDRKAIIVPIARGLSTGAEGFYKIAQVEQQIAVDGDDGFVMTASGRSANHELYERLRRDNRSGLILFSSGSTGVPKAALHDFDCLLAKFKVLRAAKRMITFLLFDHIGGINTLFYILSNGGCAITVQDRSPAGVCQAIDRYQAQVLPTSPTFINLMLLSEVANHFDLSSLELITYGTEVMPETTLKRAAAAFPRAQLLQTYGLSEVGILRSKSKASDSLWVKIGGEGFQTRVVNGLLEIKAQSAMLGYLNAPSPFTEDGWFKTGDAVLVDGEYLKILGRQSEIINVGGEKVYPAEVESVLSQLEGVSDVVVHGEANMITGQVVVAEVVLKTGEAPDDFKRRLRAFCRERLKSYQIPQKIVLADSVLHSERFKKSRRPTGVESQ